jgi:thioester reductase-like protein
VNVKGTIRLLEFAVHAKLKQLYHGSTLLTVTSTDDGGHLSENWQDVGALDKINFNMGYVISKHISEQLTKQAVERGIPCKTFRFPYIAGDSETGRCDYLTNHVVLRWLAYMKLRCMPDLPTPVVAIPVDHCAKMSLDIFLNPQAPPDVYNVSHQDGGMEQNLIGIAETFDIHIQPVSFSQFLEKLKAESADSPLASFTKRYEEEEAMVNGNFVVNPDISALQKYAEDSSTFFKSRKLPPLIPYYDELESTEDVLRRDVTFLKDSGVLEKFGIK